MDVPAVHNQKWNAILHGALSKLIAFSVCPGLTGLIRNVVAILVQQKLVLRHNNTMLPRALSLKFCFDAMGQRRFA